MVVCWATITEDAAARATNAETRRLPPSFSAALVVVASITSPRFSCRMNAPRKVSYAAEDVDAVGGASRVTANAHAHQFDACADAVL